MGTIFRRTFCLAVIVMIFCFQSYSFSQGKVKRSDFSELIEKSTLIVIVDVGEVRGGGKNKPGTAIVEIKNKISGKNNKNRIEIRWTGYGINTLGQWMLFLKSEKTDGKTIYKAAYGTRSFWPINYAKINNTEIPTKFTILRYPIKHLNFDNGLVEKFPVFINALPGSYAPIPAEGLWIDKVIGYVKRKKADTTHE